MNKSRKPLAAGLAVAAAFGVAVVGAGAARRDEAKDGRAVAIAPQVAATAFTHSMQPRSARLAPVAADSTAQAPASVARVDPRTVCMVNDRAMGKPQIPAQVGEQTYSGCCEMCKTRLALDAEVRYATDPVTGERVDKASAVDAERPDGSVLYFARSSISRRQRSGSFRG